MIPKIKPVALVAGVGLLAVLACLFALSIEKGAHADTRKELADERALVADIRSQHATQAAERAEAAEANVARMRAEIEAAQRNEMQLRRDLSAAEAAREADRLDSESRIERLKRENEELMAWAVTPVPDDWIDFMREPVDDAVAAAAPGDP